MLTFPDYCSELGWCVSTIRRQEESEGVGTRDVHSREHVLAIDVAQRHGVVLKAFTQAVLQNLNTHRDKLWEDYFLHKNAKHINQYTIFSTTLTDVVEFPVTGDTSTQDLYCPILSCLSFDHHYCMSICNKATSFSVLVFSVSNRNRSRFHRTSKFFGHFLLIVHTIIQMYVL